MMSEPTTVRLVIERDALQSRVTALEAALKMGLRYCEACGFGGSNRVPEKEFEAMARKALSPAQPEGEVRK